MIQTIYGIIPSKSNLYKTTRNGIFYKDKKVKEYEKSFYLQCDVYRNKLIIGDFAIKIKAYLKNPSQDLDGVFKCFFDTKHFEGCPDDDSLYAELMRNGYG